MFENIVTTGVWLTFASLAVSLFTLTVLVLIFLLLHHALKAQLTQLDTTFSPPTSTALVVTRPSGAAVMVAAKKAEAALKPGRSCGHCGVRIKGDPVRGIALDEKSFLVYACPECKKETLLPQ